jgi:hypothetical protein
MNIIFIICILILLLFLLFNKKTKENFNNLSYDTLFYKCNKYVITKIIKDIFKNYNIGRTFNQNKENWKLFMPCTYNTVESELKKLEITNDNKLIFGINGCDTLASKNNLWLILENKYGRQKASTLMPETWILYNKKHMELFKNQHNKKKTYIMKKNIQRKKGLHLTNSLNEIINNSDEKFRVVQKYMKNTFLINKRKINLRIYLLVICKNNKIESFVHKNGKCIYTNKDYNNTLDLEENITSLNLDYNIYKKNPFDLIELKKYFNKHNLNYIKLYTNLINNLKLLHNTYKQNICKLKQNKNNINFQLFGLDYIFDNNLNIFLLEINKGPDMNSKNDVDYKLKYNIMEDVFIKVGLINSNKPNMFIKL